MFEKYLKKRLTETQVAESIQSIRENSDYGLVEREDFRDFFTLQEILSFSKSRNGANGKQYRIDELFGNELFYKALIHGSSVLHISGDIFFIAGSRDLEDLVNLKRLAEVFPRGLPRNRKQAVTWLHYVAWLAREKYGYRRQKAK